MLVLSTRTLLLCTTSSAYMNILTGWRNARRRGRQFGLASLIQRACAVGHDTRSCMPWAYTAQILTFLLTYTAQCLLWDCLENGVLIELSRMHCLLWLCRSCPHKVASSALHHLFLLYSLMHCTCTAACLGANKQAPHSSPPRLALHRRQLSSQQLGGVHRCDTIECCHLSKAA